MKRNKGFTLIELLIVIAIIAIIAAVVFVALDPLTRFQDSRDAARWQDISAMMSAIKVDQVDNGGNYLTSIQTIYAANVAGTVADTDVFMIFDGAAAADCTTQNANCDTNVTAALDCVDLAGLVSEGYLGGVPISPQGAGTWVVGLTGYTMSVAESGIITIRSCESENSPELTISR